MRDFRYPFPKKSIGDTSGEFGVHFSAGINLILLAFSYLTVSPTVWEVDESKWAAKAEILVKMDSQNGQ